MIFQLNLSIASNVLTLISVEINACFFILVQLQSNKTSIKNDNRYLTYIWMNEVVSFKPRVWNVDPGGPLCCRV